MSICYRKGMKLFHNLTKKQIIFGKWLDKDTASCFTPTYELLNLPRKELESNYTSYSSLEKKAREKRRGQCW
jgi:hypothetical protein